jgi:hypothetical protein
VEQSIAPLFKGTINRTERQLERLFLCSGASGGLRSRDHYLTKVTPHLARLPRRNESLSEQNVRYEIKSLRFCRFSTWRKWFIFFSKVSYGLEGI